MFLNCLLNSPFFSVLLWLLVNNSSLTFEDGSESRREQVEGYSYQLNWRNFYGNN